AGPAAGHRGMAQRSETGRGQDRGVVDPLLEQRGEGVAADTEQRVRAVGENGSQSNGLERARQHELPAASRTDMPMRRRPQSRPPFPWSCRRPSYLAEETSGFASPPRDG